MARWITLLASILFQRAQSTSGRVWILSYVIRGSGVSCSCELPSAMSLRVVASGMVGMKNVVGVHAKGTRYLVTRFTSLACVIRSLRKNFRMSNRTDSLSKCHVGAKRSLR